MLPLLYEGADIAAKIVDDPATAPIPDLHKAMYAWVEKFVRSSWGMTPQDTQSFRDAGASDENIVAWAQIASTQSWFVMMADGGGISLDTDAETGVVVGHNRQWYERSEKGLLAAEPGAAESEAGEVCEAHGWVQTDLEAPLYQEAAEWARDRYGFVPNFFAAVSMSPEPLRAHKYSVQSLERPQSDTLSKRQHALVRALVSSLNRSPYSAVTTRALVEQVVEDPGAYDKVAGPWQPEAWDDADRAVLSFAIKATRNAYKITEKDAQSLRDVGLDDEGYVDVLNTIAIQTGLDRLTNCLGVMPDEAPLLEQASVGAT